MRRFFFISLSFLCNINFVFSQDESQKTEDYRYPNNDRVGYYVFLTFTLISLHLNLIGKFFKSNQFILKWLRFIFNSLYEIYLPSGCCYIFYWTFVYWRRIGSLPMVLKVPFYIACSDSLITLSELPEFVIKLHIL